MLESESSESFCSKIWCKVFDCKTDGLPIGGLCFWFSNDTEGFLWYAWCLDNAIRFAYCLPACIIHLVSASPISPSGAFLQRRFNICVTWKSSRQFGRLCYSAPLSDWGSAREPMCTCLFKPECTSPVGDTCVLIMITGRWGTYKTLLPWGHSRPWPVHIFHHRKGFPYMGCCWWIIHKSFPLNCWSEACCIIFAFCVVRRSWVGVEICCLCVVSR